MLNHRRFVRVFGVEDFGGLMKGIKKLGESTENPIFCAWPFPLNKHNLSLTVQITDIPHFLPLIPPILFLTGLCAPHYQGIK